MKTKNQEYEMTNGHTTLSGKPIEFYKPEDVEGAYAEQIASITEQFLKANKGTERNRRPFIKILDLTSKFVEEGVIAAPNEVDVARTVYGQLENAKEIEPEL